MNTETPPTPHMPTRRNWWRTFVLTGVIFFSGIVVGATIGAFAMWSHGGNENRESRFHEERFMRHVERQFDLDQEQRKQIRAIVKRHHKELKEIRQETEPRVREIFELMRSEIESVLSLSDFQEWDRQFERMERRWLGPPPSRERFRDRGSRGDRPSYRRPNWREIFQEADRDHDGLLLLYEYTKAYPGMQNFESIDKDRDGAITMEEIRKVFRKGILVYRDPILRERFEDTDRDRDGLLSLEEYTDAFPDERNFDLIDRDDDGTLTLEEVLTSERQRPPPEEAPSHRVSYFRTRYDDADRDHDGLLSLDEFTEAFPSMRPTKRNFERIDTDQDGTLTVEETRQAFRKGMPTRPRSPAMRERYEDADTDHNGIYSLDEFTEANRNNSISFESVDLDHDGIISFEEILEDHRSGRDRRRRDRQRPRPRAKTPSPEADAP